jgi:hypothetical protein
MYVWMYVCMDGWMYVRMYVCMYGLMYVWMHVCTYEWMYGCMHVRTITTAGLHGLTGQFKQNDVHANSDATCDERGFAEALTASHYTAPPNKTYMLPTTAPPPTVYLKNMSLVGSVHIVEAVDMHQHRLCVISGFLREVAENCALLGYYAVSSGNFLPTFRDNLSVPSTGFKW